MRSKEERKEEVKELLRRINQSGMELNLLQEKERKIEEVEGKFVGRNDKEFDSMVEAQYVIRKRMFGVLSMRNTRVRQLTRKVGDLKNDEVEIEVELLKKMERSDWAVDDEEMEMLEEAVRRGESREKDVGGKVGKKSWVVGGEVVAKEVSVVLMFCW